MRLHTTMNYSFDDVLLLPQFSRIKSRKDVSTSYDFLGLNLRLPVISSNMDTVTGTTMAAAMAQGGAIGCLHRFQSVKDNVEQFRHLKDLGHKSMVSVGLGEAEYERARALFEAGAENFVIDVAHGASMEVVKQAKQMRELFGNRAAIIVGNFATAKTINDFKYYMGGAAVDAYKIGIGGGSACTTRIVTGCGLPTLGSLLDCATTGERLIADGGLRTSGDIAKALAAGAHFVMLGKMLAGTDEAPGEIVYGSAQDPAYSSTFDQYQMYTSTTPVAKRYRGSASKESYEVQGKTADWRAPEGEAFEVPYVGPVAGVLRNIEGGLRSAMSYVGASNLEEFRELAEFGLVTEAGAWESQAHGAEE